MRKELVGKLLGVGEDVRKHLQAKEGGSCLCPTFVDTSPALANVLGRWADRGRKEVSLLSRNKELRSGKLPEPLN